MYSATSTLGRAVIFTHATGLRVLSVDYTVAPLAKYNQMSDEVITVVSAILKDGQRLEDTAIYGDSSGGGLAAAVVLKIRDQGLGMPAAAVKETLLSGFVRLYQALDVAGVPVKLDLYEGMIHNFQDRIPDAPEAIVARQKMRAFLYQHLGL
jgi:acetyl esterase/lipase